MRSPIDWAESEKGKVLHLENLTWVIIDSRKKTKQKNYSSMSKSLLNHSFLENFNEAQRSAVLDFENPLLVLAGAGSGKTRMLTGKIAFGLHKEYFNPLSFLAVTFTNKSAEEMKERVSKWVPGINIRESWVSTFHSFGHRVLRSHADKLGYGLDFGVFDGYDQMSVIKALLKKNNEDNSSAQARRIARLIQSFKSDLASQKSPLSFNWSPVDFGFYESYQKELKKLNSFDFSDLLLKTYHLLQSFPEVVDQMRGQFGYLFVDEYQDTNLIQYEILKKICGNKGNICVVGDEDQSIYSWRGANIFNILNFHKDFPGTRTIRMEQNYRSTQNIIGAASSVISNNYHREGKNLFTQNPKGELIEFFGNETEYFEAQKIAHQIENLIRGGGCTYSDVAVFYRTNAQSRVIEEKLRSAGIPYRIQGGLRFYDRKEIKDMSAYMRFVVNPKDDISFRRIINSPPRGLGKTTLEKFESFAAQNNLSLLEAGIELLKTDQLNTAVKFQAFLQMLGRLRESCKDNDLNTFYGDLLYMTQYLPSLEAENSIEAKSRIQNLEEFGNVIGRYLELNPKNGHITEFLDYITLTGDVDKEGPRDSVTLMTLHVAKGLEYPVVFIAGLEEGLFPMGASTASENDMELEEERRLFYVGMTRAMERVYLCFAKSRMVWGKNQPRMMSRFLKEIPEKFLKNPEIRRAFHSPFQNDEEDDFVKTRKLFSKNEQRVYSQTSYQDSNSYSFSDSKKGFQEGGDKAHPYSKGTRVRHPHFGEGVIYAVEGSPSRQKISVLFDDKKLEKVFVPVCPSGVDIGFL